MNIAVTGSDGFIGKNLIYHLLLNKKFNVFKIKRETKKKDINSILKKSDIICHLAGVNRPKKIKAFKKDKIILTKYICDYLQKKNYKKKIIFSSSTQVESKNDYGKSKKLCEKILSRFAKNTKSPVYILRLPNIFGKWSRPNYNSVVSTFCYNISRNRKIKISDPKKKVKLLYIDDLIEIFKKIINNKLKKNKLIYKIPATKTVTLKNLSKSIFDFELKRKKLLISNFSSKFEKNLYSTFISFLPKKKITYKLKASNDSRGSFTEFLKTKNNGQISVFVAKKNQIRGHHFHHSKVEKFFVLRGKAKFSMRDISSNQKVQFNLSGEKPTVVESIPGCEHYIKNQGNEDLIVLLWCNEIFDVNKPDTFKI